MKILVTGATGLIGGALVPVLRERGHDVIALARTLKEGAVSCDLRDREAINEVIKNYGPFESVVHLAAEAHNFRSLSEDELIRQNVVTTENLVSALEQSSRLENVRMVYASSVAIFSDPEVGRALREEPATAYGKTKLASERSLKAKAFGSLHILRFGPVFDRQHLSDVRKRVCLPVVGVKIRMYPQPHHALCYLGTAVARIIEAVEAGSGAVETATVVDTKAYSQHELASWFPGRAVPLPIGLIKFMAFSVGFIPGAGKAVSGMIRKFSSSSSFPD